MNDKQFAKLQPKGSMVVLSGGQAAYVFPVGFKHLTKFTRQIQRAIRNIMGIELPAGAGAEKAKKILGMEVIPIILEDLMGLVADTTVLGILDQDDKFHLDEEASFEELAHWDIPPLLEEWFELSFGEERKWTPWVKAVEKAVLRLSGQKISLLGMFSKASSSSDTTATISSNDSSIPKKE